MTRETPLWDIVRGDLCPYLSVGACYVHRGQAVGRAAESFVQALDVCQAHLHGVKQVDLKW